MFNLIIELIDDQFFNVQLAVFQIKLNKNLNYHFVGTVPKYNRKIAEKGKIDTPSTQIHDDSLSWLGTDTSLTSGEVLQCDRPMNSCFLIANIMQLDLLGTVYQC